MADEKRDVELWLVPHSGGMHYGLSYVGGEPKTFYRKPPNLGVGRIIVRVKKKHNLVQVGILPAEYAGLE